MTNPELDQLSERVIGLAIEVHRARIMSKLGARNAAELVGIVLGRRGRH